MDLEVIAAAASPVVALAALVVAVLARLDSRKSSSAGADSAEASKRSATAAERSAMTGEAAVRAAQRSADAAEHALGLQERDAQLQAADRHEAAGPQFTVVGGSAIVDDDLTARVDLRMDGGPGELEVELRATGVIWCDGLSSTGAEASGVVLIMASESGSVIPVFAHLSSRPWVDEHPAILPILVTVQSQDLRQKWIRRVPVPLVPPPVPQFAFMG